MKNNNNLTQKQENFCLDLFKGLSETESYVNHYNTSKMSRGSIYVEACRLKQNPKISLKLSNLRLSASSPLVMSETKRKERLSVVASDEYKAPVTAKEVVGAIAELNKMDGVYQIVPLGFQDNRVINIIVSSEKAKELTESVAKRLTGEKLSEGQGGK